MRLEASTLAARRFAYPELGDVAPSAQGAGERRAQRGLARARCAKARAPNVSEGGAILHNIALKRSSEAPLERGFFRQPRKIRSDELG